MGQTHPVQDGSPAWTYISTTLFGIHNSFVEDRYCWWSLILSLIPGQEKQTQSSRWGNMQLSVTWNFIFLCFYRSILLTQASFCMQIPKCQHAVCQGWVVKLVITPIFHSSMVSVDLILMKIEDPVFLSKQWSGDANCCSPSLFVLYFSSCRRLEVFNSFKLVFIIIMHFLLFNCSMQLPAWSGKLKLGMGP
jgi:hypothetical protein